MEQIRSAITFNRAFRNEGFESNLKLHKVNGLNDNVSGFVTNPANGKIEYINIKCGRLYLNSAQQFLHRTAKHTRDFTGGQNYFSKSSWALIQDVIKRLS